MINHLHGGPVIAAWDVSQLDDAWLDTFYALAERRKDEDDLKRHQAAIAGIKAKWRAGHK